MAVLTGTERPWFKFYEAGVPRSLSYPSTPLHAFLDETAAKLPDARALIFFDRVISYGELDRLVDRFAAGLQALGVHKGDRVAISLPNMPQFVIAFYGALRAGATVVPTNPLYTVPELTHQLADSGAETLVCLSRAYPVAKAAVPSTAVRNVVVANIKEYMPPLLRTLFTLAREKKEGHRADLRGDERARRFQDVMELGTKPRRPDVSPSDIAVLQYTGGTTGVPKAAMLSHRALVANTLQCRAWFTNLRAGRTVSMAVMPFFHVYGLTSVMSLGVAAGIALVLMPRLDIHDLLKATDKHKPQLFAGAPRIYVGINNSPETPKYDLRSIEACVSGSAPLPLEVAEKFEAITAGGRVVEGYGLTEAGPVTHINPIHGTRRLGAVGLPIPDVDAKIVDIETGTKDLAVGEVGEICVRGPNLMDGYYKRPDETSLVLRDGWLYTGDIGRMDEDGFFFIVDRKKELIIVSGYNVYPREVEEVLYRHPAVMEAGVVGIPDPLRGEAVKAFVALKPGASATADDIIEHCRQSLARFKVPAEVEFRKELPKTIVGKVLRRQLVEEDRAKRSGAAR